MIENLMLIQEKLNKYYFCPLENLNLSPRSYNNLRRYGICNVQQLLDLYVADKEKIKGIHNINERCFNEIETAIQSFLVIENRKLKNDLNYVINYLDHMQDCENEFIIELKNKNHKFEKVIQILKNNYKWYCDNLITINIQNLNQEEINLLIDILRNK